MNSLHELVPAQAVDPKLLPLATIVIPTFNCSQSLSLTLDSIISQNYTRYEIIVIDAGSTDRTIDLVHSYRIPHQLVCAASYDIYRMINLGIAASKGEYLNVLFPGDFYIHPGSLLQMMNLAFQENYPELVYCGTLLRDHRTEVKFLFRPLDLPLLKRGSSRQVCRLVGLKENSFKKLDFSGQSISKGEPLIYFADFALTLPCATLHCEGRSSITIFAGSPAPWSSVIFTRQERLCIIILVVGLSSDGWEGRKI